jgi:hypothetical protein
MVRGHGALSIACLVALSLPAAAAGAQAPAQVVSDAVEYRLTAPAVSRPRDPEEIEAAARRYAPVVRHCYQEEGLKEDPTLSGILRVSVIVGPEGAVHAPRVTVTEAHGLGMRAVVSCVATAAASWHFTAGPFHEERVGLSFRLRAADRS